MPRIEIELTSSRPDGSWTWRAAGARQPKGSLDGSLLPGAPRVGDVVRAEVEVELDGMTVTSILPPKTKREAGPTLEIIGPPPKERETAPGVGGAGRSVDRDGGDRGEPGDRSRRPAGGGGRDRPGPGAGAPRRDRPPTGRPAGPGRPGGAGGPGGSRTGGGPRPAGDRVPGGRPSMGPGGGDRAGPRRERPPRAPAPAPAPRPRPKRLNPGRAHRDQALASLAPEERPVAEQLLRGGVPAVRQALDDQNAAARASGAPEVKTEALLALAERLAPRLRAAEWLDRAEAAVAQAEEVALRDLRALVAGSDAVGRDETARELAGRLRQVLDERSTKERDTWLSEISEALEAGRVVRALRASGRPPEPGVRFPQPLAERLSEAANAALASDVAPDRWAAVLEAVTASPVRRLVKPQGLPSEAPPELMQAARQAADRVPGLVPLVGAPVASAGARKHPSGPTGGRAPIGAGPPRRRPPAPPKPPGAGSARGEQPPDRRPPPAAADQTTGAGQATGPAPAPGPERPAAAPTPPLAEQAEPAAAAAPAPAEETEPASAPGLASTESAGVAGAADPALAAAIEAAEPGEGREPVSDDQGDDAVLVEELS